MMSTPATSPLRQRLQAAWMGLAPRERRALLLAAAVVAAALLWGLAVQPAWRTLARAPAELERLDAAGAQETTTPVVGAGSSNDRMEDDNVQDDKSGREG